MNDQLFFLFAEIHQVWHTSWNRPETSMGTLSVHVRLVSKEIVVPSRWESKILKFGIKEVDKGKFSTAKR